MTIEETDTLFEKMFGEYEQDISENDHSPLSGLEKLIIRCFFDFIEQMGYLKNDRN